MKIDPSFILTILTYAVSCGIVYGGIMQRLKQLEKKVDKHNNLVERMYRVESKIEILESDKIKEV